MSKKSNEQTVSTEPIIRDKFIFYNSFFEGIDECPVKDQRDLYRAIAVYALKGEIPQLSGMAKIVFLMAKPQIDANNRKYINGCAGGAPTGNQNAKKQPKNNQDSTKKQPNNNVNINNNVNDNIKEKTDKRTAFIQPTLEQIQNFITENNYLVDAHGFYDYYAANGWKVGKNLMKDWKAALRMWHSKEKKGSAEKRESATNSQWTNNTYNYGKRKFEPEYIPNPNWKP